MIVSWREIQQALTAQTHRPEAVERSGRAGKPASIERSDTVDISARAREVGRLVAIAKEIPDVRRDVVEEVARSVKANTYRVESDRIAEKILGRVIVDRLV